MKATIGIFKTILIVCLAIGLLYTLITSPEKTENNIADIVKIDNSPPKVYKDPTGKTHVQKEVINLAKSQKALFQTQIDSLTKQLGVKEKQIVGLTTAAGRANIDFKPEIKERKDSADNLLGMDVNFGSRWFDLTGNIDVLDGKLTPRGFNAKFRDSISLAFVKQKGKWYADISSANKDMVYENIRSWQVPETGDKKKIGLGGTVGYGLQLSRDRQITHGLQATIGLQLRF